MAYRIEASVGLYWYSDADPTVGPGVPAPLWQLLIRTDDPSLYYKAGTSDTAWIQIGAGGVSPIVSGIQSFTFVCDGSEDPNGFPIALLDPRLDTAYQAFVMLGETTDQYAIESPPADYGITQFLCVTGAQPSAGDKLLVLIVPTT